MLFFRKGEWIEVQLPFSDPMWTSKEKAAAGAMIATGLVRGKSQQAAELAAEKAIYDRLYPHQAGSLGKSMVAQSTKKKSAE